MKIMIQIFALILLIQPAISLACRCYRTCWGVEAKDWDCDNQESYFYGCCDCNRTENSQLSQIQNNPGPHAWVGPLDKAQASKQINSEPSRTGSFLAKCCKAFCCPIQ